MTLRFYGNEIVSNFQVRSKILSKEADLVAGDVPNRIGMPTIKPASNAERYFVDFASSSTVHGLNHLVAPHRHPIETFLAALFIVGALVCLLVLSFLFWDRYQNNATVIVVDNDRAQFQILKPALFICPAPNIDRDKIPAIFQRHNIQRTRETEEFFTFLGSVTYENMLKTPILDTVPAYKWLEVLHDLRQDMPSNVLKENDPFETWAVTERGLCLATRSVFAHYATFGYWKSNDTSTVAPVPNNLPYYNRSIDGIQESIAVGSPASIAACDPFEMMAYDTPMRWIKPKILQRAVLSMSEIKTKSNVRELSVRQRKCKFFSDGCLKTWPVYSRSMCVTECRMKVIQDRCDCRPHFARPTEGVDICNATQLRCIGRITKELFLYEYPPPFCACIPKCDVVSYQIRDNDESELYFIQINLQLYHRKLDMPISSSVTTLIIELPPVIYYRSLLYGFTDFLTGVGGAAGLFLGASVLSFVEIFYYITLRVYFRVIRVPRSVR